jgi:hypothetical protein
LIDVPAAAAPPAPRRSPPDTKRRPSLPAIIALGVVVSIVLVIVVRLASTPNVPIRFYGRVVDDQGVGVPGVQVSGEVSSEDPFHVPMPWTSSRRWKAFGASTDDSGNFTVEGLRGMNLFIKQITKRGYTMDLNGRYGFNYASPDGTTPVYRPDPNQPVVFKVVRREASRDDDRFLSVE